jgi:hypothetical protein
VRPSTAAAPETAPRATEPFRPMLTMKKLDIAAMVKAFRGE